MSRMMPPRQAVTTPITTAGRGDTPTPSAFAVPYTAKADNPAASNQSSAFAGHTRSGTSQTATVTREQMTIGVQSFIQKTG